MLHIKQFAQIVQRPLPKPVAVAVEALVVTVSCALLVLSAMCAAMAFRHAVLEVPVDTIVRSMEAAIEAAAVGEVPEAKNEIWFMLPDGSFVRGGEDSFVPAQDNGASALPAQDALVPAPADGLPIVEGAPTAT